MPFQDSSERLRFLLARQDRVATVMHPPSAHAAKVMEMAGTEVGFVGTSVVMGGYTGMEDTGVLSIPESVQIGGWIARSVSFPMILDGDTGHGGIMSVRRIVEESIRAGLAGIRLDDQAIEAKRGTASAGITLAPLEVAVARYRAAVDLRNEISPSFVIMANCYAGEAINGNFEVALKRMRAYQEIGGVDWVVFTAPGSISEVRRARAVVKGPFTVFGSFGLTDAELLALGINVRWGAATLNVIYAALYDYVKDYMARGQLATAEWRERNVGNPFATGAGFREGGRAEILRNRLEAEYFSEAALYNLKPYQTEQT